MAVSPTETEKVISYRSIFLIDSGKVPALAGTYQPQASNAASSSASSGAGPLSIAALWVSVRGSRRA